MKPLALLLLLSAPVAAHADLDWSSDPLTQVADPLPRSAATPDAPKPSELACRAEVIDAFKQAWAKVDKGRAEYEAGFRIDRRTDGSGYDVVFAPMRKDLELKLPIDYSLDKTVAIAHTHPDDADPTPGPGDFASKVPNFVISRGDLYVTVPGTKLYRRVREDWSAPCAGTRG